MVAAAVGVVLEHAQDQTRSFSLVFAISRSTSSLTVGSRGKQMGPGNQQSGVESANCVGRPDLREVWEIERVEKHRRRMSFTVSGRKTLLQRGAPLPPSR